MSRKRPPRATRKAGSQKPRRRSGGAPRRGLDDRDLPPAVRVLARHGRGFAGWAELAAPHGELTDAAALFGLAELLLTTASGQAGLTDPTRCTPEQVAALAPALAEQGWPPADGDVALGAFARFLEYLEDADLWRGPPEDLAGCQEFLALVEANSPETMAAVLADVWVEPAKEQAAVAALALIDQAGALLSWVGRGPRGSRQVTATGALRRADLIEAAALVGATVEPTEVAPAGARSEGQLPLGPLPGEPDLPGRGVRGMSDVAPLARVWQALTTMSIVDVGRTTVQVGELGTDWLDGAPLRQHRARAVFLAAYLVHLFEEDNGMPWVLARGTVTAQVLLSLLLKGPRTAEQLGADLPVLALIGQDDVDRLVAVGVARWDDGLLGVTPGLERLVAGTVRLFLFDDVDGGAGPG